MYHVCSAKESSNSNTCTDTAFHYTAPQVVLVGEVTDNGAGELFYYVSNFSEANVWPSKWKMHKLSSIFNLMVVLLFCIQLWE